MRDELARLLRPLDPISLDVCVDDPEDSLPKWLDAGEWRVFARPRTVPERGEVVQRFRSANGDWFDARWDHEARKILLPFSLSEAYLNFVSERWSATSEAKRLSTRQLDVYYSLKRYVPRRWQLGARRALMRWQGLPTFPRWPFEPSLSRMLRFYVRCLLLASEGPEIRFRWFWPNSRRAALTLTHDVESAEGLRLALELASLEEERGLRSSFNLVASWYPIDEGIVRELRDRGFELGVHGVYHDRSMFSSRDNFEAQLTAVREAASRFGARGFRSPATHRIFDWLAELPLDYDCSVPHSDPFEPQPGGCCSVWPFFIGDVIELPYTLPQDHTLFTLLGVRSIEPWLRQVDRLVQENGLIQSVTHPDPGYLGDLDKRSLYEEFLDAVADRRDLWVALPRDVATWWRQRDQGENEPLPAAQAAARMEDRDVRWEVLRAPLASGSEHLG